MSTKCDCGDQECAICAGRPSSGRTAFVDPYMAQKAREDAARKAAAQAPAVSAPIVPEPAPVPVVHVQERPIVAQVADAWQPPAHLQEETQRLLNTPLPPPLTPEQIAQREQELAAALGAPTRTTKQKSAFAIAYTAWQEECVKRNAWIAGLYKDLQERQRARQEALAQWDAHVAAAKLAWEQAKRTLPPVAPRKEQFVG